MESDELKHGGISEAELETQEKRGMATGLFAIHPISGRPDAIDVTLSIGLAALTGPQDTGATILKRADQALYRAKRDGRQ